MTTNSDINVKPKITKTETTLQRAILSMTCNADFFIFRSVCFTKYNHNGRKCDAKMM